MPRLSCWFIKASLIHLALGAIFGGLILSAKGVPIIFGWGWMLLAAHIQIMIGGWMIQLALGMAYWILPRLDGTGERGRPRTAWISFGALNVGVSATALLLALRPFMMLPLIDLLLALVALLQPIALLAFAYHAWPRIAPITLPPGMQRSAQS